MSNLMNYSSLEVPNVMEIRTERLAPISSIPSQRTYTFRLEPNGFMDKSTMLTFKLKKAATYTSNNLRVNSWNGALGCINVARMRIGDQIASDVQNVGEFSTWKHLSTERREKLNKYWSRFFGNQFHTEMEAAPGDESGMIIPDSEKCGYDYEGNVANSLEILTDENNCYMYGIPLGLLFPGVENEEFPLFLFSEYKIYFDIEFNPPSVYSNSSFTDYQRGFDEDIEIVNVELLVDYLIYPNSILEAFREQTLEAGGYRFEFIDVINVQRQLAVDAGTVTTVNTNATYLANGVLQNKTTSLEFRLGQENREVHYVLMTKQLPRYDDSSNPITDSSVLCGMRCDGISYESVQYVINGIPIFPEPKDTSCSQYDLNYQALKMRDLEIERPFFYNDPNSLVSNYGEVSQGITGKYKPIAVDLRTSYKEGFGSGTMIGKYPIVIRYSCKPAVNLTRWGYGNSPDLTSCRRQDTTGRASYNVNFWIGVSRLINVVSTGAESMMVKISS